MPESWTSAEQTATNPQTGERLGLVNGEWIPIEASATHQTTGKKMVRPVPKAGWADVIEEGVMRGGAEVGALPNLIAGGIASNIGAQDFADTQFKAYDEARDRAKYWTPQGRQSTGQKIIGQLSGMVLPLAATGGNPALYGATQALNNAADNTKEGMNPSLAAAIAPVEGAVNQVGMSLPFKMGPGVKGVAKAVGAQTGLSVGDILAKLALTTKLPDDKNAQKYAQQLKDDAALNVAVTAVTSMGGAGIGELYKYLKAKYPKDLLDSLKSLFKKPETATPNAVAGTSSTQPSTASTPHAVPATAPNTPEAMLKAIAGEDTAIPPVKPVETAQPVTPVAAPKTVKMTAEEKKAKVAADSAAWEKDLEAQGASDIWEGTDTSQKAETPAPAAPVKAEEPKKPLHETDVGEVGLFWTPPHAKGEKATTKLGDGYAGAELKNLTNFDRAALAVHSPNQFRATESAASLIKKAEAAGVSEAELRAHGDKLAEWIAGKHRENVKVDPNTNEWTNPEGNQIPIDVHPYHESLAGPSVPHTPPAAAPVAAAAAPVKNRVLVGEDWHDLTPEQKSAWDEADKAYAEAKKLASSDNVDPASAKTFMHREGMKRAEKRREIVGKATPKKADRMAELAKKAADDVARIEGYAKEFTEAGVDVPHDTLAEEYTLAAKQIEKEVKAAGGNKNDIADILKGMKNRVVAGGVLSMAAINAQAADGSQTDSSLFLWGAAAAALGGARAHYLIKGKYGNYSGAGRAAKHQFDLFMKDTSPRTVEHLANIRDEAAAKMNLAIDQLVYMGRKNAPDLKIKDWLAKGGKGDQYSELLSAAFKASSEKLAEMSWKRPIPGVKQEWKPTIGAMTSIWDENNTKFKELIDLFHSNPDATVSFPYFKFDDPMNAIKEGLAQGMSLISDDPWIVYGEFAREAAGARTQAELITNIRKGHLPDGKQIMTPLLGTVVPEGYVKMESTGKNWGGTLKDFKDMCVHKSVVPSMKVTFNTFEPGDFLNKILSINGALKRLEVFGSLFHNASEVQAGISNAFVNLVDSKGIHIDRAINSLNIKEGLDYIHGTKVWALPDGRDAMMELVGQGMKLGSTTEVAAGRKAAHAGINKITSLMFGDYVGKEWAGKGINKLDDAMTHITFDITHDGIKAQTALKLLESNIAKGQDIDLAIKNAAEYSNDLVGKIDWRRIAEGAQTRPGRWLATNLFSGPGQASMQAGLFAQDWLMSTMRLWAKAVKPNLKKPGLNKWDAQNVQYSKQLAAGFISTLAIADGLQYVLTGTFAHDNEPKPEKGKKSTLMDKVTAAMEVHFPDGTHLNVGKHFKEGWNVLPDPQKNFNEMIGKPGQEAMYKLGVIPSEAIAQIQGQQWATFGKAGSDGGHYSPPIGGALSRLEHLGGKAVPFVASGMSNDVDVKDSFERFLAAEAGFPIRGMSAEQKAKEKEKERANK